MISEYNLRQIDLMKERIQEYKDQKIYIHTLINDLEALLYCLEGIDSNWKESFLNAWDILEIEYASALNENQKILDDRAIIEINKALKDLEILMNSLLTNS